MKRQYRYKTAADKKDFFTRDWFGELDEVLGKLHGAIEKECKDKNVVVRMFTGANAEKIMKYVDAYLMPKDNCAKSMNIVAQYENWYMNAWNFLEKDSYDKIRESMNKCETIIDNLVDFVGKDGKYVIDELGQMEACSRNITTAGVAGGGFDDSNNNKIDKFLNSLKLGSEVIKEWNNWHKLVDEFLKALNGTNKHYWGAAATPSSELARRVDEVYDELAEQKRNKKEDEKNKREDEKNKRDEEKRNKEITLEMNKWDDLTCETNLQKYIRSSKRFIDQMRAKFLARHSEIHTALSTHSDGRFNALQAESDWNNCVNKYFDDLNNIITSRLDPSTSAIIRNAISGKKMENIIYAIRDTFEEIKKALDESTSTPEGKVLLALDKDNDVGHIEEFNNEHGIQELPKILKRLFERMLEEFKDAKIQ